MSAKGGLLHGAHTMTLRARAADMYGNGVDHPFTTALLQRGEFERHHTCPYCGHVLCVAGHKIGGIVDHGRLGLRCTFCDGGADTP